MKRRIRQDRPTRQAQIYETAARLFCEKGFDKASMGDISSATGLTKAGLYHHIASKEELLYAIMSYGMDLFETKVLNRVLRIRDPLERLRATVRGHVLLVTRDRPKEVTVILHESNALKGRYRDRINARKRRYVRFLEKTFRELVRKKAARRIDPSLAAFATLGMINWIYQWYRPGGRLDDVAVADALTDLLLHGIAPRPAAAR
ncbi:MAG TPA: TetR/AcrR family transcriptional regulator [Candidatus Polarisedimenticolia bacterium]|nr:TetR/AcrR family transcriptional regulator [Candidatus Polarisedimenticolia bacterium]